MYSRQRLLIAASVSSSEFSVSVLFLRLFTAVCRFFFAVAAFHKHGGTTVQGKNSPKNHFIARTRLRFEWSSNTVRGNLCGLSVGMGLGRSFETAIASCSIHPFFKSVSAESRDVFADSVASLGSSDRCFRISLQACSSLSFLSELGISSRSACLDRNLTTIFLPRRLLLCWTFFMRHAALHLSVRFAAAFTHNRAKDVFSTSFTSFARPL